MQKYYKNNVKSKVFTNYSNLKKMQRSVPPDERVIVKKPQEDSIMEKEREEEKYDASDDQSHMKDYLEMLTNIKRAEYERTQ